MVYQLSTKSVEKTKRPSAVLVQLAGGKSTAHAKLLHVHVRMALLSMAVPVWQTEQINAAVVMRDSRKTEMNV
jgi:hypothetical protein